MKYLILALALLSPVIAFAGEASLPIKATIINLTKIPLDDAIAFCDEHNFECSSIRDEYEQQSLYEDANRLAVSEDGYYAAE